MKLFRFGPLGDERPGLLDAAGQMRDASALVGDWSGAALAPDWLAQIRGAEISRLPIVPSGARLGSCVGGVGKCIGIGLNYRDHAAETGAAIPKEPVIFSKAVTSLCGAGDDLQLPRGSLKTDWEVELGVVIGSMARYVERARALECVAGYCTLCDFSERAYQKERGGTWDKGKGCDTFGPIGPYLVTPDEAGAVQGLELWCEVNGVRMQAGNTSGMIFDVAFLISYVSQFMTLMPGDLIATGTPAGVGMARNPPQFLKAGDTVRLGVGTLGEQFHRVRA